MPSPAGAPQSPPQALDQFPDLMTFYRSRLPQLRPLNHAKIQTNDPARAAQIDGLIIAVQLLDGLLSAHSDWAHGVPLRIAMTELSEYKVTDEHFRREIVDFAWRRLCERYVKRTRDLLQASAVLGKPWLSGMRYRFAITRIEQILRAIQVDPTVAYRGGIQPRWTDRLMAGLRIGWRTLTGRR
ncbi:hypothetical protein [Halothiobacillus sp.]|jgi:phytoene/squalene synthetase|uniref:hypothetical protein n=1 Tax=Halothiobacillus sp. TaxID=1891311 RepID=UPI002AD51929|nr:hypothetical protein [Halothiobacillus sp.]